MVSGPALCLKYPRTFHAAAMICSPLYDLVTGTGFLPRFSQHRLRRVTVFFLRALTQSIVRKRYDAVPQMVHFVCVPVEPIFVKCGQRVFKLHQHFKLPLIQGRLIFKEHQKIVAAGDLVGMRNDLVHRFCFQVCQKCLVLCGHTLIDIIFQLVFRHKKSLLTSPIPPASGGRNWRRYIVSCICSRRGPDCQSPVPPCGDRRCRSAPPPPE